MMKRYRFDWDTTISGETVIKAKNHRRARKKFEKLLRGLMRNRKISHFEYMSQKVKS